MPKVELHFKNWKVVKGPAFLDGRIVRAVEAWDQTGGHLTAPEIWCGHNWIHCFSSREGPKLSAVMKAALATREQLEHHGVTDELVPEDYSPIRVCPHCGYDSRW